MEASACSGPQRTAGRNLESFDPQCSDISLQFDRPPRPGHCVRQPPGVRHQKERPGKPLAGV